MRWIVTSRELNEMGRQLEVESGNLILRYHATHWHKICLNFFSCKKCSHIVEYKYVANIVERAGKDLNAMEKGNEEHCIK